MRKDAKGEKPVEPSKETIIAKVAGAEEADRFKKLGGSWLPKTALKDKRLKKMFNTMLFVSADGATRRMEAAIRLLP